jgi:hypothetical protein
MRERLAPDSDCLAGGTEHYAQADMYSVKVALSETAAPTGSNPGGALWGGGVVWGSEPVTFSTQDPSGVSQVALDGPDGLIALQPQSCDYSQTQPCPQRSPGHSSSTPPSCAALRSYTQKLWMRVKRKAAYLPG